MNTNLKNITQNAADQICNKTLYATNVRFIRWLSLF